MSTLSAVEKTPSVCAAALTYATLANPSILSIEGAQSCRASACVAWCLLSMYCVYQCSAGRVFLVSSGGRLYVVSVGCFTENMS